MRSASINHAFQTSVVTNDVGAVGAVGFQQIRNFGLSKF